MIKKINFFDVFIASLFIIVTLITLRLIPHPPNFTPILASGIFAPYVFRFKYISVAIILIAMIISDLLIGFHNLLLFVYLPLIIILFISDYLKVRINQYSNFLILGFSGSVIFFIISNFGVWLITDYYPKNFIGIVECYTMAIPFFKNTLLSTLMYLFIYIVMYKFMEKLMKQIFNFKLYWYNVK